MRYALVIVDGFSLLHRDATLKALLDRQPALARHQLVQRAERVAAALAPKLTVVFDGHRGLNDAFVGGPTEVIFSSTHQSADACIERMVRVQPDPSKVLVITSDRTERESVHAAGGDTMSCGDFLVLPDPVRTRSSRTGSAKTASPHRLGDYFPKT